MRFIPDTTRTATEIIALIADAIDYSNNPCAVPSQENKPFYGTNTSDGFVIEIKHGSRMRGILYRFKVVVNERKDGKAEMVIHSLPGVIHFAWIVMLFGLIVGHDYRTPLLDNLWFKTAFGIMVTAVVLIPNVIEFISVRNALLELIV